MYVSLKLSFVTTAIIIVISAPLAYVLAQSKFPGKTLLEALINLPMALPPTVMGFYLIIAMGPKGLIGRAWKMTFGDSLLFTFGGITVAAIISCLPYALQPMKASFRKIDRGLLENAYILGLSYIETFIRIVIPNSINGIVAAAILVFLHCMGAFGIVLMVGGSISGETKVLSIAIYESVEAMNYLDAGIMSLCFIPIGYIFLLIMNRLSER